LLQDSSAITFINIYHSLVILEYGSLLECCNEKGYCTSYAVQMYDHWPCNDLSNTPYSQDPFVQFSPLSPTIICVPDVPKNKSWTFVFLLGRLVLRLQGCHPVAPRP
jgi:hypothetical protein